MIFRLIPPVAALAAALLASYLIRTHGNSWSANRAMLVQRLNDPDRRTEAFYNLRQLSAYNLQSYEGFASRTAVIDVIPCPQKGGALYLVVTDDRPDLLDDDEYPPTPPALFDASRFPQFPGKSYGPQLSFFTEQGQAIDLPIWSLNDGTVRDLNGDGILECIYLEERGSVEVLHVATVTRSPKWLLSVVINGETKEWTYRLRQNGDRWDIEVGPLTPDGFLAKSAFQWTGDGFVQSDLLPHKHLRVLVNSPADQDEDPRFEPDPDAPVNRSFFEDEPLSPQLTPTPYQSRHFARATDAEIIEEMSSGSRAQTGSENDSLPADFWTLAPEEAALALANENRSDWHRANHALAILDDGTLPPSEGAIAFDGGSSICYNAVGGSFFLKVDPHYSYLAYAGTWSGGAVLYNWVTDQVSYDFRLCPLSYADAKHVYQTIWWLDRVRSRSYRQVDTSYNTEASSTADGSASYILQGPNGELLRTQRDDLYFAGVRRTMRGNYRPKVALNLAQFLMTYALPEKLGGEWSRNEPRNDRSLENRIDGKPKYTALEVDTLRELTAQFLNWAAPRGNSISYSIAATAASAAADLQFVGMVPKLRELRIQFTEVQKPVPTFDRMLDRKLEVYTQLRTHPDDPSLKREFERLEQEIAEHLAGAGQSGIHQVVAALERALDLLGSIDAARLFAHITKTRPIDSAKLQLLKELDGQLHRTALASLLPELKEPALKQAFSEIAAKDPAFALEQLPKLGAEQRSCVIYSPVVLEHILKTEGLPSLLSQLDEALPSKYSDGVSEVFDFLAPPEEPLRFPSREIDEAFLRWAQKPEFKDTYVRSGAMALAIRGREEFAESLWKLFNTYREDNYLRGKLLEALGLLSLQDGQIKGPMVETLDTQFKETNWSMNDILWLIWAADLRVFKPELTQFATGSTDDFENPNVGTSGGPSSVKKPSHLARQILRLWEEQDKVTRMKLTLALLAQSYHFHSSPLLKEKLALEAAALNARDKEDVERFLNTLDQHLQKSGARATTEHVRSVLAGQR